ncbi:hypothetical protein Rsub_00766 [Raphidocelis subcapitata]|uniref:non-specific serine/threonine protein kinase n=1 Tax=Raphidocelis subcapitata TaxID=307507 RepID=A0A2V0NKZ6_9CHLO|nr:hypothetical protein Rsub_00766 [Raphidocelis subcapitata]|eukprot:GBF88054.1 hypothetical protein Rsub_00766 [Raphidocelis subcapitata]
MVLRDVANAPRGEAEAASEQQQQGAAPIKTFQRRQPGASKSSTAPAPPPAAATPAPSASRASAAAATPASEATPLDTPSSIASDSTGAGWTPGPRDGDGDDAAGAAAAHAWRPPRRAAGRSSLLPGAALPGGAAWREEAPGTRVVQRWRGRGMSRAKRAALEEYLAQMAAHFAEVDAFELIEEDEEAATPYAAPPAASQPRAAAAAPTAATPLPLAPGGASPAAWPAGGGDLLAATPERGGGAAAAAPGAAPAGRTRSASRRGASLLASTPGSDLAASTPASSGSETPSSSAAGTPLAPWTRAGASAPRASAADGRRSSMAHGLLRRQTLLPAGALRPDAGPAAAAGTPASGAAQLRARQRLSSLSLLPPLAQPPRGSAASAAPRVSGRPSFPAADARRSSLLPAGPLAGRRSGSLAAAAAARRSSARDSLAPAPGARRSAAAPKQSLAVAGRLPGAVVEEDEEGEEAAAAADAAEKLAGQLDSQLRVEEGEGADGEAADVEEGVEEEEVEEEEDEAAFEGATAAAEAEAEAGEEQAEEEEGAEAAAAAGALTPLQQLLSVCGQGTDAGSVPGMEQLLGDLLDLKRVTKLGEGTYGEVFRAPPSRAYLDALPESEEAPPSIVVKIIPMEGAAEVNGAPQKGAGDLMAEAAIALALSSLRADTGADGERLLSATSAYVRTCRVGVCRGRYPKLLVKAWKAWDKAHGSENDPVEGLEPDQAFCVLAMEEAGRDLEAYRLSGFHQARSVLLQAALALAVGEEALGFEHRDLHWGNVLLRAAPSLTTAFRLRGMDISVQTQGVLATLIDFTASRLQTPAGDVAFCDLSADPELFQGPKGNCQADTYRRMLKLTRGEWAAPFPATNTLWLHYLADIILTAKAPGGGDWAPAERRALRDFRRRAAGYGSAQAAIWDELFEGLWVAQEA